MSWLDALTWRAALDFLAAAFLLAGVAFMVIGALGVVRLPDAYNRIHAASITVTLGLTGMLLAACYHLGAAPIVSKALITVVFIFVATPIGSHMLAKAAHDADLAQWERTLDDELTADKQRLDWSDEDLSPRARSAGSRDADQRAEHYAA